MVKVTVDSKQVRAKSGYPCLKITNQGRIVLFTKEGTGVALVNGEVGHTPLGDYKEGWAEDSFKLFRGKITLSEMEE